MEPNGTTEISRYQRLSELDGHYNGIIETLTAMAAKSPEPIKAELTTRIAATTLLRHQVVGLVGGELAKFEAKQIVKLVGK